MNVDQFLEHHGVKGQKWGVRKTRRIHNQQVRVDRFRRAEAGKATGTDKFILSMFRIPVVTLVSEGGVSGASEAILNRERRRKQKIVAGEAKVRDILLRAQGVDVRTLNFAPLKK